MTADRRLHGNPLDLICEPELVRGAIPEGTLRVMPESHAVDQSSAGAFRRLIRSCNRRDRVEVAVLAAAIALLHLVGFGALVMIIAAQ